MQFIFLLFLRHSLPVLLGGIDDFSLTLLLVSNRLNIYIMSSSQAREWFCCLFAVAIIENIGNLAGCIFLSQVIHSYTTLQARKSKKKASLTPKIWFLQRYLNLCFQLGYEILWFLFWWRNCAVLDIARTTWTAGSRKLRQSVLKFSFCGLICTYVYHYNIIHKLYIPIK